MRAAVYHGPGDVRIESVPDPREPGDGEVLIEVSKAAICGTDSAEWAHGPLLAQPPVVLGHEFVGHVVAAGSGVSGIGVGDRVVSGAGISCGQCSWCGLGRTNLCERYRTLGLHVDGGLAEYVVSPAAICRRVPAELDDVGAAMAQPFAVALHAARRGRVGPDRSCVVLGVGGIGAFVVAAASALGAAPVIAVDVSAARLKTAAELGASVLVDAGSDDVVARVLAETGGQGAEVVIEATGVASSPGVALRSVRRGGDVVVVGLQAGLVPVDLFSVSVREIDVHGTLAHVCGEDLGEAVSVLAGSRIAPVVLGGVIALDDLVGSGLRPLAERTATGKIVVDVRGSTAR